jgi:phospholipid-binding lipoprotein MlaA
MLAHDWIEMLPNLKRFKLGFIIGLLSTALLQSACSSVPETQRTDRRDPYEGSNRKAFAFNMGLDTHVLEPAAAAYKNSMPKTGQRAIENHLDWTGLPATTLNSTLQGRYENAGVAFLHFAVNGLTLGLAELTEDPTAVNSQDFGQTLAHLNVPEGNFLMVPFLGPNTSRSLTGKVADTMTNPMSFLKAGDAAQTMQSLRPTVAAVSYRSKLSEALDDIKYNSLDPYARTRSLYYQSRAGRINAVIGEPNNNKTNDDQFESFFEDTP